jgi:alkylation response protein AidB-like acyl-CoA dehydrogenase
MELEKFRASLDRWLDDFQDALAPDPATIHTLDGEMSQLFKVKRYTYDAGWMRWGWPKSVGGYGGSTLLRGYLGEALAIRDLVQPGFYCMQEMLAPPVISYGRPEVAAELVPRLLNGDEMWCQGFSEPGTGSNLGSLACRAVRTDEGWRVTGQKVWTSLAQFSARCLLLTRTGTAESAHRGITAMLVDTDSPGITIRPFRTMHGVAEFSEVFFDDVLVPFERTLGEEGQGWAVAMDLLPFERSSSMWLRNAYLYSRLESLVQAAPAAAMRPSDLGDVIMQVYGFRAQSWTTQHRLAAGEHLGPETSVDKILMSTTEQALFDLAESVLTPAVLYGDDPDSERWRSNFLYSRAATIYGGSLEIQRNILARRVLELGAET